MTRKSPPAGLKINHLKRSVIVSIMALSAGGCSVFSPRRSSQTDYEEARRSIEDPGGEYGNGIFRPEGLSAEREGDSVDFLQRIGLRKKRRRDIEAAREEYAAAQKAFDAAKSLEGTARRDAFRSAATSFKRSGENWQSSSLEQDALLMAAESLFFAEDYYQSEQVYAQLIKEYPRNPYLDHVDSRRFEIADYWLKVQTAEPKPFVVVNFTDNKLPWNDTGGHGKRVLENLRLDNPTGKVSDDATMRLAVDQFERGDFESAASTFSELRMTYPDSEHLFNSQYLELQSLMASYQGPEYSSVPLTEAEKRVKAIVRLFPQEASEKQAELKEAYAKVRFLQAERIWNSAEYRLRQGENRSARFHYQQLLDEFPDTPFADQAREQMAAIEGKSDRPPQRLVPLIKLFGADNDDRPYKDVNIASEE